MDGAAFGVQSCLTKDRLWVNDVPALVGGVRLIHKRVTQYNTLRDYHF